MTEMSGRLTWNEVADIYQHNCGGTARILPMDTVFDAVEKLPFVHLDSEGYLHRILDQKGAKCTTRKKSIWHD